MSIGVDITSAIIAEFGKGRDGESLFGDIADKLAMLNVREVRISFFSEESNLLPAYLSRKAVRYFSAQGFGIYIVFHLSDSWADPSNQKTPDSWRSLEIRQLFSNLERYLERNVLELGCSETSIRYVQVGNEITNGMLWPVGHDLSVMLEILGRSLSIVRNQLKTVSIVVHTDLSGQPDRCLEFYRILARRRIEFDRIGLSYYPCWHGEIHNLQKTLEKISLNLDMSVVLSEFGYMHTKQKTESWHGEWRGFDLPYSPRGQSRYICKLVEFLTSGSFRIDEHIYYWGGISCSCQDHYPVSLFDDSGAAFPAAEAIAWANRE